MQHQLHIHHQNQHPVTAAAVAVAISQPTTSYHPTIASINAHHPHHAAAVVSTTPAQLATGAHLLTTAATTPIIDAHFDKMLANYHRNNLHPTAPATILSNHWNCLLYNI